MKIRESLTSEKINERFENRFDLVLHAIKLVEDLIMSGRAPLVKCDVDNPALIVLEEIVAGKNSLEEKEIEKKPVFEDLEPRDQLPEKTKKETSKTKEAKI